MIKHRTRIIAAVLVVVAAVAALVADRWLQLTDDARALLHELVKWGLALIGAAAAADALGVERRRVDPAKTALPDDIRDDLPPEA